LEQVAELNGTPLAQPNWRHGPIAWRIDYVLRLAAGGGSRQPIDRLVRRAKLGLWALLAVAVAANAAVIIWETQL